VFQQRIFTPLGMNGSSLPPATDASIPDPHPHLYMFGTLVEIFTSPRLSSEEAAKANATAGTPQDVTFWSLSQAWTGGSAISTVHDLKIWAKALATGKLLSAAAHQEQLSFTPQSNGAYGLGVANFGGFLGHNGADPGLQSWMGYQPQKGATIVVLTNLFLAPDRSSLPADQLAGIIQQELFA
jgi:D-alanyl-D-alanine carboxypeptidase